MGFQGLKEKKDVYKLFCSLFAKEPTVELLRLLQLEENEKLFKNYKIDLFSDIRDLPLEEQRELLAIEYTSLFLMPAGPAPPHESLQRGEARLWGDAAVRVSKIYKKFGFELDGTFKETPDHLSTELSFLAELSELESEYTKGGLTEARRGVLEVKKYFLKEHLLRWFPNFKDKVCKYADLSYYRGIATFLNIFLHSEWEDSSSVKEVTADV